MKAWVATLVLVASALGAAGFEAGDKATEFRMAHLEQALRFFQVNHGRYPTQSEGLAALAVRPGTMSSNDWRGPYSDGFVKDGWGRDFVYIGPGIHNPAAFDLYSRGKDGISKTGGADPDDINNWDKSKGWQRYYSHAAAMRATVPIAAGVAVVGLLTATAIWVSRRIYVPTEPRL